MGLLVYPSYIFRKLSFWTKFNFLMILQYVTKIWTLVPSGCKKLQFLKLLKKLSFAFRWKTCVSALQAPIRYKLLDSVIEKTVEEHYSDTYVRFGHKRNKKNPTSSESQLGFRRREKKETWKDKTQHLVTMKIETGRKF